MDINIPTTTPADPETQVLRDRLKRAIKAEIEQEEIAQTFWHQAANRWDLFKFIVPLLLACSLWAVRVEVNQARNEARFEAISITLNRQNDTLRDIQGTLKDFAVLKDERTRAIASIEAKIDILMERPPK